MAALRGSVDEDRLLPLPRLIQPDMTSMMSSRIRGRCKQRRSVWRIAMRMASSLGWLYCSARSSFLMGKPVELAEMCDLHQQTWLTLLRAGSRLHVARRAHHDGSTGAQSLEQVVSVPLAYHGDQDAKYVNLIAAKIAEPSCPEKKVVMLDALPPEVASFYSCEEKVLQEGGSEPDELNALAKVSRGIGGARSQYVAYFNRPEIKPLWNWIKDGDQKATMGFKAVTKKDGSQRKILTVLQANYMFGPPWRRGDLGLYGAASLAALMLEGDEICSADFDQENCFTYIETPPWMWLYFAGPPLLHNEVGGAATTGLALGPRSRVRPVYRRLPMGCTLSVDIVVAINQRIVGSALIETRRFHLFKVLGSAQLEIFGDPSGKGLVMELFAGKAGWTWAMFRRGWAVVSPIDSAIDARMDLLDWFFLEKILMLAAAGLITVLHSGTPCNSFSRAITPPWRSTAYPLGVPGLPPLAQLKVDVGNALVVAAASLLQAFDSTGSAVSNENPRDSWQWEHPKMKTHNHKVLQEAAPLDYCAFGTPWKKPTMIKGIRRWLWRLHRLCTCQSHAVTLRGSTINEQGKRVSWTSVASPYPDTLTAVWAEAADEESRPWQQTDTGVQSFNLNTVGLCEARLLKGEDIARYSHIDDHIVLGAKKTAVQQAADAWADKVEEAGFIVKERPKVQVPKRYLGFTYKAKPAKWTLVDTKLVLLDAALGYFLTLHVVRTKVLQGLLGSIVWALLLRRCLLSILQRTFVEVARAPDDGWLRLSPALKRELRAVRDLLPLVEADLSRKVLPFTMAQDAEGASVTDAFQLGGWGLGMAVPDPEEIVQLSLEHLARGVPKLHNFEGAVALRQVGKARGFYSDFSIPTTWTDGSVRWYDLLARAHSYRCSIHIYEGQVLLRSLELVCKRPAFRNAFLLCLEDNQVVCGAFARGRSSRNDLNRLCRRKASLEIASGISLLAVWCSTGRMPMDKLSRTRVLERF